jgi:hypothetical protein
MTVSSPVSKIVHVTHEAVADYTFPFKVFKAGELAVALVDAFFRVIPLELGADYTVAGLGLDQGGSVTLSSAGREKAGTGLDLVILRRMDFTQETDYRPHDIFPAETHERALDVLTMICQELREQVGRAMIAPPNLDRPIQFSDLVDVREAAETARDEARAEAERAAGAAGTAADEVRGELAGLVSAAEAAQGKAMAAKTQARGAATGAKNSAALARKWAADPEDEEVRDGLFSARHYAAKAAQASQSAADANDTEAIWAALAGKVDIASWADKPLADNGWCKLPDGLILQWGKAGPVYHNSSVAFAFPIAYPNDVFCVVGNGNDRGEPERPGNVSAHGNLGALHFMAITKTGASVHQYSTGGGHLWKVGWLAIGY